MSGTRCEGRSPKRSNRAGRQAGKTARLWLGRVDVSLYTPNSHRLLELDRTKIKGRFLSRGQDEPQAQAACYVAQVAGITRST